GRDEIARNVHVRHALRASGLRRCNDRRFPRFGAGRRRADPSRVHCDDLRPAGHAEARADTSGLCSPAADTGRRSGRQGDRLYSSKRLSRWQRGHGGYRRGYHESGSLLLDSSSARENLDPMNIAIVGCGYVAEFYAKTLAHYPELKLSAAFDRNAHNLQAFCRRWAARAYPSMVQLLDDPSVELILNLTNPRSHYEITRQCIEAGKHVDSEK